MAEQEIKTPRGPIGPYEIQDLLGEGTTAKTYGGRHTGLNRPVAIKFLHQELTGRTNFAERFKREAQALAALTHPNIVAIHDCGEHDGQLYMVLEFVDGRTIREMMDEQGTFTIDTCLDVIRQVLLGLECAHGEGILHRDIKPDNLLVNSKGVVKIGDFGLAKREDLQSITRVGAVVGTPYYMAPEQCAIPGWPTEVNATTDLYAVGAVLFELITQSPPFRARSLLELAERKVCSAPPDLKALRPDAPADLDAIIRKLLASRQEKRYAEAGQVLEALEPMLPELTAKSATRSVRRSSNLDTAAPIRSEEEGLQTVRFRLPQPNILTQPVPAALPKRSTSRVNGPVTVILRSKQQDYELRLEPGKSRTLGRSSKRADIPLRDQRMSRLHCEISLAPEGGVWIRDMGSSNGTYVNNRRIEEGTQISNGDTIQTGDTVLTVHVPQASRETEGLTCARCGKPVRPGSIVDGRAVILHHEGLVCARCALEAPLEERLKAEGFLVEERIDRTGRTSVYRAKRASIDEVVALKVLDLERGIDPDLKERFRKNARSLARLHHPSAVMVFDVRQTPSLLYMVMEYIVGEPLFNRVERRGQLPFLEGLQIVFNLTRVCELCEGQNLYHRNLSPHSVMITADGETKLTAFALGGEVEDVPPEKLRFAAPECIRGARKVDAARADIYSLGALIVYTLTGQPPYATVDDLTLRQKISARSLTSEVPSLQDENKRDRAHVERLVARCLEIDPASRPASMRELAGELEVAIKQDYLPEYRGSGESLFALLSVQTADGSTARLSGRRKTKGLIAGTFEGDELSEFIQMVGLNRRTGTLTVAWEEGSVDLYLNQGAIVGGVSGDQTGLEAARLAMSVEEGTFEFSAELPEVGKQFDPVPAQSFLLDALRAHDERRRGQ